MIDGQQLVTELTAPATPLESEHVPPTRAIRPPTGYGHSALWGLPLPAYRSRSWGDRRVHMARLTNLTTTR